MCGIHPSSDEVPKKTPLLQLADKGKERFQKFYAPVPASTPFTSPLKPLFCALQAEGRFQRYFINSFFKGARHAPSVRHLFPTTYASNLGLRWGRDCQRCVGVTQCSL